MSRIHIIVGSVMGTALQAAQFAAHTLSQRGHQVRVNAEFQAGQLDQAESEVTLICTSNTGMGDLPANITPLLLHLTNDFPRIANSTFAIINLGDSSYPNFGQAGYTLDDAFRDLGATPLIEMLVIDAIFDDDPQVPLTPWLSQLDEKLR